MQILVGSHQEISLDLKTFDGRFSFDNISFIVLLMICVFKLFVKNNTLRILYNIRIFIIFCFLRDFSR